MNIGVISYVASEKSGSRSPIELAKALAKNNRVTFYALEKNAGNEVLKEFKKSDVNYYLFKKEGIGRFLELFLRLRKANHNVLTTHTTLLLFMAAKFSGKPIVNCYYGTQLNVVSEKLFPSSNAFINLLDKLSNALIWLKTYLVLKLSGKVVTISYYCKNELKRMYQVDAKVAYLGAVSKSLEIPSRPTAKTNQIKLLSVSRFTPYKGFHQLIRMVDHLNNPNVQLTIAGSPGNKNYLKYLKGLKGNFKIIVNPNDSELKQLYQHSDIYVSYDKYLFFGMPILEAASNCLPTVSANFAAINEVILHNRTGFIAEDEKQFTKYLKRLIGDDKMRTRFSKEARTFAQRFTWEKTANKYQEMLSRITK